MFQFFCTFLRKQDSKKRCWRGNETFMGFRRPFFGGICVQMNSKPRNCDKFWKKMVTILDDDQC